MNELEGTLKGILTADKLLAVHHLKYQDEKGAVVDGKIALAQFWPDPEYAHAFYDLVFNDILVPLSQLSLRGILDVDLASTLLPSPEAHDFPEQCLGLIVILDQTRILTGGSYGARYTRCFFDPIAERLARQLVALPEDSRPDGKQAWLARGYTYEQWVIRAYSIWAPLVHSDKFMVNERQQVKDLLHSLRTEVETHYQVADPFAPLEAADDVDPDLFPRMITEGPPESIVDSSQAITIWEFAFWYIRICNAHFALTDKFGRYPYACQWKGEDPTEEEKEYVKKTGNAFQQPGLEVIFEQIRKDVQEGTWQPLRPSPKFDPTSASEA